MLANTSSPEKRHLQPLKKRKVEIKDEFDNDKDNVVAAQDNVNISPNEENNNDEHSQATGNNHVSQINDLIPKVEDHEETRHIIENDNGNDKQKLPSDSQSSLISIRMTEELCTTPKKNTNLTELIDAGNIKVENTNSPQVFSPSTLNANSIELHSTNIKTLIETPTPKKGKNYPDKNNTPVSRKKRKLSNDQLSDDQLSDVLKSELYDTGLNDMEHIDMLHDLNSVIDFEDSKISTEFMSSTAINPGQDYHNIELSRDPQTDPLFIASNDESNTDTESVQNEPLERASKVVPNKRKHSKNSLNVTMNRKSKKSDTVRPIAKTEDKIETYYFIKSILGDLDIQSQSKRDSKSLSEDTERNLYDLEVHLMHEVPPQHKLEHTAGSRPLTEFERQSFIKLGPLKKGVFSPSEDQTIINNWKTFCKVHGWNPRITKPFTTLKNGNKFYIRSMEERQKFVQFLANELPWRSLFSVYQRFKKLYEKKRKHFKRYTSAEDEKIWSYMQKKRPKPNKRHTNFSKLAKILDRPSHSIWLRYHHLQKLHQRQNGKPLTHVKWTLNLIGKFITSLMDITVSEKVEDLKDATIPKLVWVKLQEKLDIDCDVLRLFWVHQLHMQLFCPESIYMNDLRIKLIEYIYGKGLADTREILWPNVAKYFEGVTSVFLSKIFYYLVQETVQKIGSRNFIRIIDYLYNEKISIIRNESTDKFLPRLFYNNGQVRIIDEEKVT